jgi:CHAT domain-containing protein
VGENYARAIIEVYQNTTYRFARVLIASLYLEITRDRPFHLGRLTMSLRVLHSLPAVVILLVLPVVSQSQSTGTHSVAIEAELLSSLLSLKAGDQEAALKLLKEHREIVTPHLGDALLQAITVSTAVRDSTRSLFLCDVAKAAALQLRDRTLLGRVTYREARTHFEQDKITLATQEYLQSKAILEEAGARRDLIYVLSELGTVHIYSADYLKAEQYSRESLALAESFKNSKDIPSLLPDEYGSAFARSNLGQVAQWKGDYETAIEEFNKALVLWKGLPKGVVSYVGNIVDALCNIAHVYQALGDHIRSLDHLTRAREIAKNLFPQDRLAAVLNDIGVLYLEQSDYAKASDSLSESLRMFTRSNNKREIARNLLNLAVIDQRQGNNEASRKGFQESLIKAQEAEASEITIAAEEGLGSVYQAQGNYALALESFEKAQSLAQAIGDKVRLTELHWRKGQAFYLQHDYSQALTEANSAADLAKQLRSPLMTYFALTLQGQCHRTLKSDTEAARCFLAAINSVERMRDYVAGAEKEQQLYFERRVSPYREMVAMLVEQQRAEEALSFAERAKARVLLDVLRNGRVNFGGSLGQSEQSEERRLYGEMVSLNSRIRAARIREDTNQIQISTLETELEKARNKYEMFQTSLFASHPELKAKRGLFASFTLQGISTVIPDPRTAALEYVMTDDKTFLFIVTRDSSRRGSLTVNVLTIDVKKADLSTMVERFRSLLSTNHPGFRQIGRDLYDMLIKPAAAYLSGRTTVCIVPDGSLWNLPFQAVQDANDKYLLESCAIYYAPSLQVLDEMKKRSASLHSLPLSRASQKFATENRSLNEAQLYAVGNPSLGDEAISSARALRNIPFVSLPETEKEVETLSAEVYGPQASSVRVGPAAREDTLKSEIGKYRVLHFATHGVLDDKNPLYSYLVLAPGGDSSEDGLLEAWELMQMDLKAELAVLSACETARGRVGDGEGLIGMTWALFMAGVPTTIASQWQVPSETQQNSCFCFTVTLQAVHHAGSLPKQPLGGAQPSQ